jgi:hypothetical protein
MQKWTARAGSDTIERMPMRPIALVFALSMLAPVGVATARAPKDEDARKLAEHLKLRKHIKSHVKYPATKQAVVTACKGMSEIKAGDRKWFAEALPDGTYETAADVMEAVGWEVSDAER